MPVGRHEAQSHNIKMGHGAGGWGDSLRNWSDTLRRRYALRSADDSSLMSPFGAVDGSHRRHLGAKVRCCLVDHECLNLANNGPVAARK